MAEANDNDMMVTELYKLYRPCSFKEVFGQAEVIIQLRAHLVDCSLPHNILFTGPSGCGKTTLARILKEKLGCHPAGFVEINAADSKGIDMVRDVNTQMNQGHLGGRLRVYIIDECHKLTSDAQSALLKIMEDTPKHVYFFLCTTDPAKLLPTIKTRCKMFQLAAATPIELAKAIGDVIQKSGKNVASQNVVDKIITAADGSFRAAMVLLNTAVRLPTEEAQLASIVVEATERQAFDLVKKLLWEKATWLDVAALLKQLKEQAVDIEPLRRALIACAAGELLKGGKNMGWANLVIECFAKPFFDSGWAGLCSACFEVMQVRAKR